jgi:uncharacterized protein with LGFP repeats
MSEAIEAIFSAPLSVLLIVAGLAFLAVAALGNVKGKVEPGKGGRIFAAVLGIVLFVFGIWLAQPTPPSPSPDPLPDPIPTPPPDPIPDPANPGPDPTPPPAPLPPRPEEPCPGDHQVQGAIRDKYVSLGAEKSFLRCPKTGERSTPDGVGRFNHFQGGSIYWTPATGAQEVHGAIRDKWKALGWERSVLGYPITDEKKTPDGVGRFNHFQRGSIYWTPGTGAHEVHGAIREKWKTLGWERSWLGYPTSDEMPIAGTGGKRSTFVGGRIDWFPGRGATAIRN